MKKIFNKSINDSENLPVQIGKSVSLKHISNITIDSVIAEGGFSIVYLAKFENQTTKTKEKCALKRLVINSGQDLAMCKREIDIMKALKGKPNVVNLIDYKIQRLSSDYDEEYDGTKGCSIHEIFLLMNYYPNNLLQEINAKLKDMNNTQSLSQSTTVLANQLRMVLDESHICTIFTDLCRAVSYLHEKQPTSKNQILPTSGPIIHRDLKIENILKNVGTSTYVLCDFGSCVYEKEYVELYRECSEVKRNMTVMEDDIKKNTTLAYRSPEMVDLYSGYPITIKADIWALGCLLYKLCYLSTPFGENTLAIMEAKFEFPNITPCPEKNKLSQTETTVPSKYLKTLIKSMLQANPDDRPTISIVLQCIIALKEYHLTGKLSHNIDDMLLKKQRPLLNKECNPSLDVSHIERRIGNSTSNDKLVQNYNTSIIPRQRPAAKKMASDKLCTISINPTNTSENDKKQLNTVELNSKQKFFDPFLSQNMEASDDIGTKTEAVNSLQNTNPENQIPDKILESTLATTQSFDDSFDMNDRETTTICSKTSAQKDVWNPFSNHDMESRNLQFNRETRNIKYQANSITSSSYSSDGSSQSSSTEINHSHRFDINKTKTTHDNKNISSYANNSHTNPYNSNSKKPNTLCAANFSSSQDSLNQQLLLDGDENEDGNMLLESISTGNEKFDKKFTTDQHAKNFDYHRDFLPRTINRDDNGKNNYDSDFKRQETFKSNTRKHSFSSSQSSSSDSNPESFSDNNESDHYTNRLKSQSGFCMSHSSPEITRSKFQRLLNPTEEGGFQTSGNNSFNNSSTLINDEIVWKLCANKENTELNMHNPTTSLLTNKINLTTIPSSIIQNSIYSNAQLTCNNTSTNTNNLFEAFHPTDSTKQMVESSLNTVPTNHNIINSDNPHLKSSKEDSSLTNFKNDAVQEIFHDHPPPPREKPPTLPQSFLAIKNENGEFKNESYHIDAFPSNIKAHRRRPSYDLYLSSNNTNTSNQSSSFDIYSSSINCDSNASNAVGKLENSNTKSRLLESNFQSVANKLLAQTTLMNNPSPSDIIANNTFDPNLNITTNPTRLVIAPHKIKLKSSQSFMQRKKPENFFYSNKDVVKTHVAINNNSNTSIAPNYKTINESNKKGNNAESFTFSDEHFPAFSGTLNAKKSAYGKLIEDPVVLGNESSIRMDNYLPQNDSKTTTKVANLSVKTKHFTLPTSGVSCNDTKKTILAFNSKISNGNGLNAQKSKSDSYRTLKLDHYTVGTAKDLISNNLDSSYSPTDSSSSVFQEHLITSEPKNDRTCDKSNATIKTTIASSLVGSSLTFCRTAGRFSRNKIALQQNSKSNVDSKSSHKNLEKNELENVLNGAISVSDIVNDMESCLSLCKFLPTASNIQNQSLNDLADVFNDNLPLNRLNTGKETTVKGKVIIETSMKDKPTMLNDKKSKKSQRKSNVGESVPSSFNNILFDVENKNILDYNENMMDLPPLNFDVQNTSIQNKSNVLGSTPSNKKTEKLFTLHSPVAAINYGFSDR